MKRSTAKASGLMATGGAMLTSGAAVVGFWVGFRVLICPSREGLLVDAPRELDLRRACSSLWSRWFSWRSASSCRQIAESHILGLP